MDCHSAAFTLRAMAAAIVLMSLGLRALRVFGSETLIIAVALGLAMSASAAVFEGNLTAFACLLTGHVLSVMVFQGVYRELPVHPVRVYRRMRGHS